MSATESLLQFAAWTATLVTLNVTYRVFMFVTGNARITAWPRDKPRAADPGIVVRLGHTHANALETLPIFAAVVVAAHATGKLPLINALAPYIVYARVGQTLAHLSGTSTAQVFVRASFFSVQIAVLFWMIRVLL